MQAVYLYHLSAPLGNERHQAQHYVGSARDLGARDAMHRRGRGSHFTRAAVERGITLTLARVWDGCGRDVERRIKRSGRRFADFCPICAGELALRRARYAAPAVEPTAIDRDEWPDAPPMPKIDGYEIAYQRAADRGRSALIAELERRHFAVHGFDQTNWDDGLL